MNAIKPKPSWLKVSVPHGQTYNWILQQRKNQQLATVCEEARCPNIGECWASGTATFMVMGDTCTRSCRFCNVKTHHRPAALDPQEPQKLADTLHGMNLRYVVITTVDRDDLADQGSGHIKQCIEQVKAKNPDLLVEILMPDFQGQEPLIDQVIASKPAVMAHNLETVEQLQKKVRDRRANYHQSLKVLEYIKKKNPNSYTKTSLMLGLGETFPQLYQAMRDMRSVGVDFLTLGQYLKPRTGLLDVVEYLPPEYFQDLKTVADELGFLHTASGPLVRSSYKASEVFIQGLIQQNRLAAKET